MFISFERTVFRKLDLQEEKMILNVLQKILEISWLHIERALLRTT